MFLIYHSLFTRWNINMTGSVKVIDLVPVLEKKLAFISGIYSSIDNIIYDSS